MINEKPNMEFSGLAGRAPQDGITVTVSVYRMAGSQDPWTLEVIDQAGWSTIWDTTFTSDEDALYAFTDAVEEGGGMRAFLEPPSNAALKPAPLLAGARGRITRPSGYIPGESPCVSLSAAR
ncbi:hypothetical protein [Methylorubrum extorquens]